VEKHSQFGGPEGTSPVTCSEFDVLLSDALDGVLSAASQGRFDLHRQQCATCSSLFRETAAGLKWLNALEDVEPPANLVHSVLAATSVQTRAAIAAAPKLGWKQRISEILGDLAVPFRGLVREPRLVMTAAMAIFSLTLSLNLAGVKLSDFKHIDLRPSAIRETATIKYTETTNRVIHYYESIRLVYEVETRLQELKRATTTPDEQEQRRPVDRNKTENKQDQERKQNYYSMDRENMQLAKWSTDTLNSSIPELCLTAKMHEGNSSNRIQNFVIAELPSGLQSDKSSRSLLA
jgi:hypothetical protein